MTLACIPTERRTPAASYMTIIESTRAMANSTEVKPLISPTVTAMPMVEQLWLDGIPPVLANMRKSTFPVRMNLVMIFSACAVKLHMKKATITWSPRSCMMLLTHPGDCIIQQRFQRHQFGGADACTVQHLLCL